MPASAVLPQSALNEMAVDFLQGQTCRAMLLADTYTPNRDGHTTRDDVQPHEVTGTGYVAGGEIVTPTVARDDGSDRIRITFPGHTWDNSTITAAYAAYYFQIGPAATDDPLIYVVDFDAANDGPFSSNNSPFILLSHTQDLNNTTT